MDVKLLKLAKSLPLTYCITWYLKLDEKRLSAELIQMIIQMFQVFKTVYASRRGLQQDALIVREKISTQRPSVNMSS